MSEHSRGWPFPDRPGFPLNPEKDGLHYITDAVALWKSQQQKWALMSRTRDASPEWLAEKWWAKYRGPCPDSSEISAAQKKEREAGYHAGYEEGCKVDALSTSVLYQSAMNEGKITEREKIASQVDCKCHIRDEVLDFLDEERKSEEVFVCQYEANCGAILAALIRAGKDARR